MTVAGPRPAIGADTATRTAVGAPRARHVVVGLDPRSGPAGEIVTAALGEALRHARSGDRVTVVAGFDPAPAPSDWPRGHRPSPTVDEQAAAVREATLAVVGPALAHLRGVHRHDGVTVDVLAPPQEPHAAVLAAVRRGAADELVLPRADWPVSRLRRLVREAPCAVTAVPGPTPLRTISPPRSAPGREDVAVSGAGVR